PEVQKVGFPTCFAHGHTSRGARQADRRVDGALPTVRIRYLQGDVVYPGRVEKLVRDGHLRGAGRIEVTVAVKVPCVFRDGETAPRPRAVESEDLVSKRPPSGDDDVRCGRVVECEVVYPELRVAAVEAVDGEV